MKKVIFLILLFILLAAIAMAASRPGEMRGNGCPGVKIESRAVQ
jgi:hypothetical protein